MARAQFKGSCEDNLQFVTLPWGMCDHFELQSDDAESPDDVYKQCKAWTANDFWEVRGGP